MSNKKRHSAWKIKGVVEMPRDICFILLWNYQEEMESQPSRIAIVIFCGSVPWGMLCLATELCVINSVVEILPLASRTLFCLSSQRDSALMLTLKSAKIYQHLTLWVYHLRFFMYLTSKLQTLIKVFNRNGKWIFGW